MKFRAKIWALPASAAAVFIVGLAISYGVGARTSAALDLLRRVDYPFQENVVKVDRGVEQFRLTRRRLLPGRPEPGDQRQPHHAAHHQGGGDEQTLDDDHHDLLAPGVPDRRHPNQVEQDTGRRRARASAPWREGTTGPAGTGCGRTPRSARLPGTRPTHGR